MRVGAALVLSLAGASLVEAKRTTPAETCAATKLRAASKQLAAKLTCYQKAVVANGRLRSNCLVAAETAFAAAFARAEAKGGCATTGDAGSIQLEVDADVAALVGVLSPVPITTTPTTTSTTRTTSTTTTTLTPTSTTTTVPACQPLGSSCGACGSGTCRTDVGGMNICAGGLCVGGPCTADADCGAAMVCVVFLTDFGTSTTCCTDCP